MTIEKQMGLMSKGTLLVAALGLSVGCAAAQKMGAGNTGDDSVGGGSAEADPLAAVKSKKAERKISVDAKEDFDKALNVYAKLKKNGRLDASDCDEAADAFRRVADEHGDLPEARFNQGAVYVECGKEDQGLKIIEKLAGGSKPYAAAVANMGYVEMKRGNKQRAEELFEQAIKLDQQVSTIAARLNLAQLMRERARASSNVSEKRTLNDQAIRHLRTVLALDGNSLQAYSTLCFVYYDLGLPDAAKLIGDQAINRAEEIATGKFQEDDADAETVDTRAPAKGKGKAAKADEPKRTRQVEGGGTGYTPEMKRHLAVVHNTLGLVSLDKKRYSDAIASFRKAVEMDGNLHEARMNLASVSLKFRNYGVAEENFRAVLQGQPKNYEATIGLGVALRGNKKVEDAEAQYTAAQKLDPQRADSYYNLGLLYQEYKDSQRPSLERAQQFYREFISRAGGGEQAKLKRDAEKRIKDIDELFVALQEAEKLQREAEELQRKAEQQQKDMEQRLKQQEQQDKAGGAAPAAPAGGGAALEPVSKK